MKKARVIGIIAALSVLIIITTATVLAAADRREAELGVSDYMAALIKATANVYKADSSDEIVPLIAEPVESKKAVTVVQSEYAAIRGGYTKDMDITDEEDAVAAYFTDEGYEFYITRYCMVDIGETNVPDFMDEYRDTMEYYYGIYIPNEGHAVAVYADGRVVWGFD